MSGRTNEALDTDTVIVTRGGKAFEMPLSQLVATPAAGGAGGVIQQVAYVSDNVGRDLGTGSFPQDDTLPQISEGIAYSQLDIPYTPLDAANILHVQAQIALNSNNAAAFLWNTGLFRSDQTDAIGFAWGSYPPAGVGGLIADTDEVAGTVSPITFSVRVGVNIGTAQIQAGGATVRFYGGALKSWMRIIERTP